jgi:hypothetical protein
MWRHSNLIIGLLIALLALSGCGLTSVGALEYNGPTEQTIEMGKALPGSDIRYVNYSENGAEIWIGNQPTTKKIGDSLDWKGSPVPGVDVAMSLRIVHANADRLITGGTMKIVVHNVSLSGTQFPDRPTYTYKVPVTYNVRRGATIPGTTVTYVGKTDSGAEFGGVSGYPYRRLGDSVSWSGRLQDHAYLDTTLRVIAYTGDFAQIAGLATIGLTE